MMSEEQQEAVEEEDMEEEAVEEEAEEEEAKEEGVKDNRATIIIIITIITRHLRCVVSPPIIKIQ